VYAACSDVAVRFTVVAAQSRAVPSRFGLMSNGLVCRPFGPAWFGVWTTVWQPEKAQAGFETKSMY